MNPLLALLAWPISLCALVARLLYLARREGRTGAEPPRADRPVQAWVVGEDGAYIEDYYFEFALD